MEIVVASIPSDGGITVECSVCGPLAVFGQPGGEDKADAYCRAHLTSHGVSVITYD